MKADILKITYINPLTKIVETTDYVNNDPNPSAEVEKEIHEYLESKFGEEIIYKITGSNGV